MLLPILTKQCEVLNSYFSVNSFHNWTPLLPLSRISGPLPPPPPSNHTITWKQVPLKFCRRYLRIRKSKRILTLILFIRVKNLDGWSRRLLLSVTVEHKQTLTSWRQILSSLTSGMNGSWGGKLLNWWVGRRTHCIIKFSCAISLNLAALAYYRCRIGKLLVKLSKFGWQLFLLKLVKTTFRGKLV